MTETIGPHRLVCGDLTQGAVAELMAGERADVIYSDPPWGAGNQQYWHTMNRHGSAPRTTWAAFLAAFCEACAAHRTADAPVFVEMGLRWVDELDAAMRAVGLEPRRRWRILYGPKKKPLPNVLSLFGPRDVALEMPDPPHGEPATRAALAAVVRPGSFVLDPCTGLGMTARITHALGGCFRGSDLNQSRLERTATWLRARTSAAPALPAPNIAAAAAEAIRCTATFPEAERVAIYNEIQRALGELVRDVAPDPACAPQLIRADAIDANDYNPNAVAAPELDLLETSMRADGITMAIVVMPNGERALTVDGFHRRKVGTERLGRRYLPCSVIDRPLADRMASTVRHNRARGKHQVELMAALVKGMMALGWEDDRVAEALGMSPEELLRLRQMVGAAELLAAEEYSRPWGNIEEPPPAEDDEEAAK